MQTADTPQPRLVGDTNWDGLHRPRIYYAIAATFCGLFLSVLDGSICNVALPSMAAQLGVPSEDSIWIVNAFQLAVMMLLLPFASLGELFGYKRVYVSGIVVFSIGSLLCALAPSFAALVVARTVQAQRRPTTHCCSPPASRPAPPPAPA